MFSCDFSIAGFDNSSVVQAKVVKQLVFDVDKGLSMYRDFCAISPLLEAKLHSIYQQVSEVS